MAPVLISVIKSAKVFFKFRIYHFRCVPTSQDKDLYGESGMLILDAMLNYVVTNILTLPTNQFR